MTVDKRKQLGKRDLYLTTWDELLSVLHVFSIFWEDVQLGYELHPYLIEDISQTVELCDALAG